MIIGISVVKNEEDIIEAMLRHNLKYLDKIFVYDNGSADKTPKIVEELRNEGLNCSLEHKPGVDHKQHEILSAALPEILEVLNPVRVIPLDADEFIRAETQAFRREMEGGTAISLRWMTYVPTDSDDHSIVNPLERIRHRLENESRGRSKVTVPRALLGCSRLSKGSHRLLHIDGQRVSAEDSKCARLAHFPIRSRNQLMSKALIGSWSVRFRNGRTRKRGGEARQWHDWAGKILIGAELGPDALLEAALWYGGASEANLLEDPIKSTPSLKYTPDQNHHTLLRNIVQYTDHLLDEAIKHRET